MKEMAGTLTMVSMIDLHKPLSMGAIAYLTCSVSIQVS